MLKVFVICGHGAGDPGACANGFQEAVQVRRLAARMRALGGAEVQVGDTSRDWYRDNGIGKGHCPKGVPVIELHMDSAGAGARGGHVIVKEGFAPDAIDNALASFIGGFLPGRAKTIAGRSNLANVNRAAKMGVNYRLLECGFISDPGDAAKFEVHMDDLARGILAAFGVGANPTPAPAPQPAPSGIAVDGYWGEGTTRALQRHFGTPIDGIVSSQSAHWRKSNPGLTTGWEWVGDPKGSRLVAEMQEAMGIAADGLFGPSTANALIRRFRAESGATVEDGRLDADSPTVRAMQRAINEGRF